MKKITAILIMNLLLLQLMGQFGMIAWFHFNQRAIAAKYCENKSKPNMHCNGRCHLAKQLRKARTDGSAEKRSISQHDEVICFILPESLRLAIPILFKPQQLESVDNNGVHRGYIAATFQPPPFLTLPKG